MKLLGKFDEKALVNDAFTVKFLENLQK